MKQAHRRKSTHPKLVQLVSSAFPGVGVVEFLWIDNVSEVLDSETPLKSELRHILMSCMYFLYAQKQGAISCTGTSGFRLMQKLVTKGDENTRETIL